MSAAEKLRALDAKAVAPPWLASPDSSTNPVVFDLAYNDEDCEVIAALRNALPQIVAVVEIAQRMKQRNFESVTPLPGWVDDDTKLYHALAALDEALA